jgi:hypothetical protein
MSRRAQICAAALVAPLVLFCPSRAAADDLQACFAAHEDAQRLRREGKIAETRARLEACTREACPAPVRQDCTGWLDELAAAQPTVVVIAREARSGAAVTEVRISVDGRRVADRSSGSAIEVDPGQRRIRVEARDGRSVESTLLVSEGDKGRRVELTLPAPPERPAPSPSPPEEQGLPAIVFVLGGVGVAGMAGFGVLAGLGLAREGELADECEPRCSVDRIDGVRHLYLAGDIAGAVGVLATAAAVTIAIVRPTARRPALNVRAGASSAWIEGQW